MESRCPAASGDLQRAVPRGSPTSSTPRARSALLLCELPRDGAPGEWDLERLAQVLANLLDNALKYSPRAHPGALSTYARGAETVLLEVHNHGAPIPERLLPLLFEPFRRGEQTDETVRTSLGLGLYIAHDIVRAHGGSLTVHSTAEEGTTFRVCLSRPSRRMERSSPGDKAQEDSLSETV